MSTIARQPVQRGAAEPRGVSRALVVRWEISPRALLVSRGAAVLNGHAAKLKACSLVVEIDGDRASAWLDVALTDGGRDTIVLASDVAVSRGLEAGLQHVEAAGVLEATLRERGDGHDVLYARTPLLERALGLPGGVYDRPSPA